MDDFDIEDLKVHKIKLDKSKGRIHLPVAGARGPALDGRPDIDEAFGGSSDQVVPTMPSEELEAQVVAVLKTIFDPEIPINIYDLGLIYGVSVKDGGDVEVRMTLTAPACPVAGMIVSDVAERVGRTAGVRRSHVKLVWDPPWTKDRMSEDALLELGLL